MTANPTAPEPLAEIEASFPYGDRVTSHDEWKVIIDYVRELEAKLVSEREDNLWNAYHNGHEQDGKWSHNCMSDGEWLARECGLNPADHPFDAGVVKGAIPVAARSALTKEGGQ